LLKGAGKPIAAELLRTSLLDHLKELAQGKTYQNRGLALFYIECLAKRSDLARSFVQSVSVLDGSEGFIIAARRAREVLRNIKELTAEPGSAPAGELPQEAAPPRAVAAATPSPRSTRQKLL